MSDPRSRRWSLPAALALAFILATPGYSLGGSPQATGGSTVESLMMAARDLIERRTSALVEGVVPTPLLGPLASDAARAVSSVVAQEQSALSELTKRRDVLRQVGEAYTSAKTVLTLQNATISQSQIDLFVTERTALTYKKVVGDEPDFTAFVAEREFHFVRDAAGWVLVSHGLTNQAPPVPINEPTGATADEMQAALREMASAPRADNKQVGVSGPEPDFHLRPSACHLTPLRPPS